MEIEARCIECGCPAIDHLALRYVWGCWWRHRLARILR